MERRYRPNVAIVILNDNGMILACERSDVQGAWQLPQGGVHEGEELETAAKRELREEIGTDAVHFLGKLPFSIRYDWPEAYSYENYHGQEQSYFLARIRPDAVIDLNADSKPEFQSIAWMSKSEFLNSVKSFKREAYLQAFSEFTRMFPGVFNE